MCEAEGSSDAQSVLSPHANCCPRCPNVDLPRDSGQKVLAHMGAHILCDSNIDRALQPCGFCLRPSPICSFYLRKTTGGSGLQIDLKASKGCINSSRIQYKKASESTASSPCSNVPIQCPLCSSSSPAVWKYNFAAHFATSHPNTSPTRYANLYEIPEAEKYGMKSHWKQIKTAKLAPSSAKSKKATAPVPLKISAAHSSRLALSQ